MKLILLLAVFAISCAKRSIKPNFPPQSPSDNMPTICPKGFHLEEVPDTSGGLIRFECFPDKKD